MSRSATITREQLLSVYTATELGGSPSAANHFSYAKNGNSTYSFGVMQFDVGNNKVARTFLKNNGFTSTDIENLSTHGGISRGLLNTLDEKLLSIPAATINKFTNDYLDQTISIVSHAVV